MNGSPCTESVSLRAFAVAAALRVCGFRLAMPVADTGDRRGLPGAGPRAPDDRRCHGLAAVQRNTPFGSSRQTWCRRAGEGPALNGKAILASVLPRAQVQLHQIAATGIGSLAELRRSNAPVCGSCHRATASVLPGAAAPRSAEYQWARLAVQARSARP